MVVNTIKEVLTTLNQNIDLLPENYRIAIIFFMYFILIAIYSVFIWKFYRFLARKNIIKLNLDQYNTTKHPGLNKFIASLFYLLEYIIIIPILVAFWFSILAFFLLVLSKEQTVTQIITVAAAVVGVTRFTSYISEDLSKDVAKLLPFTVLGIFLISPTFFSFPELITKIGEVPSLFNQILIYLIIIAALEIIIRLFYVVIVFFTGDDDEETT